MKLYLILALLVLTSVNPVWANQDQEQTAPTIQLVAVPVDSSSVDEEEFTFPDDVAPPIINPEDLQPTWREKMALMLTAIKQLSSTAKDKLSTHVVANQRAYVVGIVCVAGATIAIIAYYKHRQQQTLAT